MRQIASFLILLSALLPGKIHSESLHRDKDSVTVYLFLHDDCVISQFYTLTMNALYEEYGSQIEFIGLFPNFSAKPENIAIFQEKYQISFLLKQDYYKVKTKKFGITVTPEVVVYHHGKDEMIYRGRIDDVRLGKRKLHPRTSELEDVLKSIQNGIIPDYHDTRSIGCFITFNDAISRSKR